MSEPTETNRDMQTTISDSRKRQKIHSISIANHTKNTARNKQRNGAGTAALAAMNIAIYATERPTGNVSTGITRSGAITTLIAATT
jgi:hypothetical protein